MDNRLDLLESTTLESGEGLKLVKYPLDELRKVSSIPLLGVYISANPKIRQQHYEIWFDQPMHLIRRQGIETELGASEFVFLEACDEDGRELTLAVRPEFVWQNSEYWLSVELIEWSVDRDDEIFNIIFYCMSKVCNFFGWTLRRIVPGKGNKTQRFSDAVCLLDKSYKISVLVCAHAEILEECEARVRHFSMAYSKNCLWLGSKVTFKLEMFLDAIQPTFMLSEIIDLKIGDLIPLKQNWPQPNVARLASHVTCRSTKGKQWRRKVFLRIDKEDARMEFDNEEWELEEDEPSNLNQLNVSQADGFRVGERGPDAVELDILVGTTTISFNELCNIQEGSLIEISCSTLPIVKMNVAGETLLEGELVRLGEQLMVQITKKVA